MAPYGVPDIGPEQPDTTRIRAFYARFHDGLIRGDILALCDALDAARAELKVVKDFKDYMLAHDPGPFVTELEERAEAAEARIAAALAILHDCHVTAEDMNRVRRALAERTGQ